MSYKHLHFNFSGRQFKLSYRESVPPPKTFSISARQNLFFLQFIIFFIVAYTHTIVYTHDFGFQVYSKNLLWFYTSGLRACLATLFRSNNTKTLPNFSFKSNLIWSVFTRSCSWLRLWCTVLNRSCASMLNDEFDCLILELRVLKILGTFHLRTRLASL